MQKAFTKTESQDRPTVDGPNNMDEPIMKSPIGPASIQDSGKIKEESLLWGRHFRSLEEMATTQRTYAWLILLVLIVTLFNFVLLVAR